MKVHRIKGYIQSLYLVDYSDKLMLLDSGCRCDVKTVQNYIENDLGRKMSDLKLVLVSHIHPDHAGGANSYKSKFNTAIAIKEGADNWYLGWDGLKNYFIDIVLTWYVAKKMKKDIINIFFKRRIKSNFFLKDNSLIPGFEDWMVISTPGHTDSDLTFYHKESGVAYIADNLIKLRNNFIIPHPVSFPEDYKTSLKKYIDLDIKEYLLAHGGKTGIDNSSIEAVINKVKPSPINNKHILKQLIKNLRKHRLK